MPQCAYEEGLVPPATDSGGPEKHGGVSAFLVDGFQVRLLADKDGLGSQQYMAFMVGNLGFYEFTCMLFGLCNALATFQHLMQNTLGELNLTYCVIYLDDVIVFGRMEEEHLECLHVVFEWFREFNLKLKPSKCSFFQLEIVYLAHHVSHRGILPSWGNVWAHAGIPDAQDLYAGPCILWTSGALQKVYQGICQYCTLPLYDMLGRK